MDFIIFFNPSSKPLTFQFSWFDWLDCDLAWLLAWFSLSKLEYSFILLHYGHDTEWFGFSGLNQKLYPKFILMFFIYSTNKLDEWTSFDSVIQEFLIGTSLVVQWLKLCLPVHGAAGSILGQGAKILYAWQPINK